MRPVFFKLLVLLLSILFYVCSYAENKKFPSNVSHKNAVIALAINDTFTLGVNTGCLEIEGNVLHNDSGSFENGMRASLLKFPPVGNLVFKSNGSFTFQNKHAFTGEISFRYKVNLIQNPNETSEATVYIIAGNDHDYDNILDIYDIDDDNDGILDEHEGFDLDSDNDNICNSLDIDSDNDGITDNIEWQTEGKYIEISGIDINENGWDDAYEPQMGGKYYKLTDTDKDGTADFLDRDSDNDRISDCAEGFDFDGDKSPDIFMCNTDSDFDGLDDSYDNVDGWSNKGNSVGSKAILIDSNKNGIRDWRDDEKKFTKGLEEFFNEKPFGIFPNPSDGIFKIRFNLENEDILFNYIKIYNINGELVLNKKNVGMYEEFDLSNFDNGVYLIRLRFDDETHLHKIVIY